MSNTITRTANVEECELVRDMRRVRKSHLIQTGARPAALPPFGAPFPMRVPSPVVRDAALRAVHAVYAQTYAATFP